jgi:hypothetical protein
MSTSQLTERDAFNAYIDNRWGGNLNGTSLEEALQEFRNYQNELADAQFKIREAIRASDSGELQPMNDSRLAALFDRQDALLRSEAIED